MTYLLLSILSSSAIFLVFKVFGKMKIDSLNALVVNYITACLLGIFTGDPETMGDLLESEWLSGAVILGLLFILVFYLMIKTTRHGGISVVSVASKMSVVLSVVFVIFYYDEQPGILKITGIILALVSVYLVSVKNKKGISIRRSDLLFPLLVFFGSGIIESGLKFLESTYVGETDVAVFSSTIFAVAASVGIIMILIRSLRTGKGLATRDIIGGLTLGIPNYYSVYFFIKALRTPGIPGSTIFIINNVAIVLLSTFFGILFFRESLLIKNWIGIALAVISIILVAISTDHLI